MLSVFHGEVIPIDVGKDALVTGRKMKLRLYKQDDLEKHVDTLKGTIRITVSKFERSRSNQQNRWLWGVAYELIADHTGHDKEEIHEWVKDAIGLRKEVRYKGVDGKERMRWLVRSTTEYSVSEMTEFMNLLQQWAVSELGVNIPNPNEVEPENKDFGIR